MVAGLVAVHISAYEALRRDVLVVGIVFRGQVHGEQPVQPVAEGSLAAHAFHHPIYVVRHMEREVPRVALDESLAVGLIGVQVFLELPVAVAWRRKPCPPVEGVAVVQRPLPEGLCHALVAHRLGGRIDGPVVEGIFQRVRGSRRVRVEGRISQFHIVGDAGEVAVGGSLCHGVYRLVVGDVGTLHDGVRQHRDGMVARHAPPLVAHQAPYGQHAHNVLLLMAYHRLHHVRVS